MTQEKQENKMMPKARVQVAHPYLCLMGLYLGGFTGMYSETALNVALPELSGAFGVNLGMAQWLVVGYMLVIGLVLPFSSLLMKWFSARKITLFALVVFLIGSLMSTFAPNFPVALAGRAVQGIGTGLVLPLMFAMVMEVVPPNKIGSAMGVNALVIMSASAIGPTLSGILMGALGWRSIFASFAVVLAVAIAFAVKFGVNPYELTKPRIDALSVITSCLGFGGIVLGAGIASLYGWGSAPTIIALVIGVVSLVIYARRQFRMEVPVINLNIFRISRFTVGAICVMLNFGITLSLMYVLPQFYQNALGLSATAAGLLMLPGGIVNVVVSALSGNIYDRIGARIPGRLGFALSAVGALLLLLFSSPVTPVAFIIMCHIILMVSIPLAMSPCQSYALSSLPPRLSPDGSTMLNTMQQVVGAICTALATFLLSAGETAYLTAGGTDTALAFTQGAHAAFLFSFVLAVAAFLLALRIQGKAAVAREAAEAARAAIEAAQKAAAQVATQAQPQVAGQTASAPLAAATATADASELTVRGLMRTPVFTLRDTDTALDALKLFADKGISGAPVINEKGKLCGFVSDGDVIAMMSRQNSAFNGYWAFAVDTNAESFTQRLDALTSTTVGSLATRDVLTVSVHDDMRDVCTLLAGRHLKKVPVMDGNTMVGIINRSNITRQAVERYAAKDA